MKTLFLARNVNILRYSMVMASNTGQRQPQVWVFLSAC